MKERIRVFLSAVILINAAFFLLFAFDVCGESADEPVIIWKEVPELLPQAGWSLNRYLPAGDYDPEKFWTGSGAGYFRHHAPSPLRWRFEVAEEMCEAGVDLVTREYHIWVHQYGYQKRKISIKLNGQEIGTVTSRMTEELDDTGESVSAGHFIWQKAGKAALAGGRHELVIEPYAGHTVLVNALVLTSDKDIVPRKHELKEKSAESFFRDVPPEWHPYMSARKDVYGLLEDTVTRSTFDLGHTGAGRIHRKEREVSLVFDLPEGLKITRVHQRFSGPDWVYGDYEKVRMDEPVLIREGGGSFVRCRTRLSYIDETDRAGLSVYFHLNKNGYSAPLGKDLEAFYHMEWEGGKSERTMVVFRVAELPDDIKPAEHLIFGASRGIFEHVNPSVWPELAEITKRAGMNAIVMWGNLSRRREGFRERQKMAGDFYEAGVQVLENYSPWYHRPLAPASIEEGAAAGLDGELYRDYKNRTLPCPSFVENNPYIEQQLDIVRTIASHGVSGMTFDDERFNHLRDEICYCERCVEGFRGFLGEKYPGMFFMEPAEIVKNKEGYPEFYDAWIKFRALGNTKRHRLMKEAFSGAVSDSGAQSTFERGITIAQITIGDGNVKSGRELHLWDLPSLAGVVDYVCPMIYVTTVSRVGDIRDRLRNVMDSMAKEGKLLPTLNCGYGGPGSIVVSEKPLIKYSILEAVMNGSRGALFWNDFGTYDPLSLEQISAAVSMLSPHEEIIINGEINHDLVGVSNSRAAISAIDHDSGMLVLVSEYSGDDIFFDIIVPGKIPYQVIDASGGQTAGWITPDNRRFSAGLDENRAKLYFFKRL